MAHRIPLCATAVLFCLSLAAAQSVRGTVVDPDGTPLAGARVVVIPAPAPSVAHQLLESTSAMRKRPIAAGQTNAKGRFGLDISRMLDPESERYVLWVISDSHADLRVAVQPPAGGELDLGKITLVESGTIQGTVRGADGRPIAGATVRFTVPANAMAHLPPQRHAGWTTVTDAQGRYRIRSAPPHRGHLVATAEGRAANRAVVQAVIGETEEVEFSLRPGRQIAGVVTVTGIPIANAEVALIEMVRPQPKQPFAPHIIDVVRTGADGRYRLRGVDPAADNFMVAVQADGFLPHQGTHLDAGQKSLRIALHRCPTVRLRVRGDAGAVLRRYTVHLLASPSHFRVGGSRVERPDTDGIVTLGQLPEGMFHLDVRAPGYAPAVSRAFELRHSTKAPSIEVQVDRGSELKGRVVNGLGRPVAGAQVQLTLGGATDNPLAKIFAAALRGPQPKATTDTEGRFHLQALRPGKYDLQVRHAGHAELVKSIAVDNPVAVLGDLVIHQGVRVLGVTKADGEPCPSVRLSFTHRGSRRNFSVTSGTKGAFMFTERLPPGTYDVMCAESNKGNPLQMMLQFNKNKSVITIKSGQTVQRLEIALQR